MGAVPWGAGVVPSASWSDPTTMQVDRELDPCKIV